MTVEGLQVERHSFEKSDMVEKESARTEILNITKCVTDTSKSVAMITKPKSGISIQQLLAELDQLKVKATATHHKLQSSPDSDPHSLAVMTVLLDQLDNLKVKALTAQERSFRTKGVKCADPFKLKDALFKTTSGGKNNKDILQANCSKAGLQSREEIADNGDCFFEAVRDQLKRLGMPIVSARRLRKDIVMHLRQNPVFNGPDGWIRWQDFVHGTDYLMRMSKKGENADHVIVFAMAHKLQRDIVIVTSRPESDSESNIVRMKAATSAPKENPILLGHTWENHFQSLQPIGCLQESGN